MFRRVFGRNGNDEGKTIRSGGGSIRRVRHNSGGGDEGSGIRLLPVPALQVETRGRPGGTDATGSATALRAVAPDSFARAPKQPPVIRA